MARRRPSRSPLSARPASRRGGTRSVPPGTARAPPRERPNRARNRSCRGDAGQRPRCVRCPRPAPAGRRYAGAWFAKTRWRKRSRALGRSGDAHALTIRRDHVAPAQLATPARLRLAVDGHGVVEQQRLRFGSGPRYPGQLEELAEPNHLAGDLALLQGVDVARWPAPASSQGPFLSTASKARGFCVPPFNRGAPPTPRSAHVAEEVQIQGSSDPGKIRNPLGVIGLTLITLGI